MGKRIAILGSTGSIGRRTLDVVSALGPSWSVVAMSAGANWRELASQVRQFRPRVVAVADPHAYKPLADDLSDLPVEVLCGAEGITAVASADEAELVLCAIVGAASLAPAFAAVRAGKDLALASKEALVVSGELLLDQARRSNASVIPVDSEHSAVFQAIQAGRDRDVVGITLTASGGPFLDMPIEQIRTATVDQALAHPVWSMGPKITVDSATMMNKGLEIIEAHYLFSRPVDQIKVVIHPESIVHSLVEFSDGVMIAQMSQPDMAVPIQYALTWPERTRGITPPLDLAETGSLTFRRPDPERFPALQLAYTAAQQGGSAPAVLNAANEQAVDCFIRGEVSFGRIVKLTECVLGRHKLQSQADLTELLEIDQWARQEVLKCLKASS